MVTLTLHLIEIGLLIAVLIVVGRQATPSVVTPAPEPEMPVGPVTYPSLTLHLRSRDGKVRHERTIHQAVVPDSVEYASVRYYKTDYSPEPDVLVYQERTRMSDS